MMRKVRSDRWRANPNGDSSMVSPSVEWRVTAPAHARRPSLRIPHPTAGSYINRTRCWVVHNYREHLAD